MPSEPAVQAACAEGVKSLAAWAAAAVHEPLPDEVMRRAALVLIDDVAAMIAARDEPQVRAVQEQLIAGTGPAEATVFRGGRDRADRYSAATANGLAADWCELDEGYRKATCHAGLYVLPALLAEAEATDKPLEQVLRALAVAYEATARLARAFHFPGLTVHPHGSFNSVGAASGVAALRGYDAETFLGALSAAATMVSPGPYHHAVEGALVRNVWSGIGASTGLRCADWAPFGITGRATSPAEVYAGIMSAEPRPRELTGGLGEEWAIADGYHKIFACCQYGHSAVEATLALLDELPDRGALAGLERIEVETHWRGRTLDTVEPATTLAAKFSMPHILAAATLVGNAGQEAFTEASLTEPRISQLRRKVELRAFEPEMPWPNDRPARVSWHFRDGSVRRAECLSARGGPDRPFAPADILEKVAGIVAPVYPRLASLAPRIAGLDPDIRARGWRRLVEEISGGAMP